MTERGGAAPGAPRERRSRWGCLVPFWVLGGLLLLIMVTASNFDARGRVLAAVGLALVGGVPVVVRSPHPAAARDAWCVTIDDRTYHRDDTTTR